MQTSKNETLTPKKWALLIILYILGCAATKGHELGPLFFPYQYQDSNYLRNFCFILAAYLPLHYILTHILMRKTDVLLSYHRTLLKVNIHLSVWPILIIPLLARGEIFTSISLVKYTFIYDGTSMGMLLISAGVAFIRARRAKTHN